MEHSRKAYCSINRDTVSSMAKKQLRTNLSKPRNSSAEKLTQRIKTPCIIMSPKLGKKQKSKNILMLSPKHKTECFSPLHILSPAKDAFKMTATAEVIKSARPVQKRST
jgi:hypothetical protein